MNIAALLLLAGSSRRFQQENPTHPLKQFLLLEGKPLYQHALETLLSSRLFNSITLVCPPDKVKALQQAHPTLLVIPGGKTRQESVFLGLQALKENTDYVLIHDAARPWVSQKILQANIEAVPQFGAVNTCIPSADTLVHAPDHTQIQTIPPRHEYFRGQTPQTFRYDWILKAHKSALERQIYDATDDCQLALQAGYPVTLVEGSEQNRKVTTPYDLTT